MATSTLEVATPQEKVETSTLKVATSQEKVATSEKEDMDSEVANFKIQLNETSFGSRTKEKTLGLFKDTDTNILFIPSMWLNSSM